MQDLAEKLQIMDKTPDKYMVVMELPDSSNVKAVIQCAVDADAPYLWQVVTSYTTTHFKTMREAMDFCRQRGWL